MPRGNGWGPLGTGLMTGRGAGSCARGAQTGVTVPGAGRGCGFGNGRGMNGQGRGRHGNRNMFLATGLPGWMRAGCSAAPDNTVGIDEKQALTSQAEALKAQLDSVHERLAQLETKSGVGSFIMNGGR